VSEPPLNPDELNILGWNERLEQLDYFQLLDITPEVTPEELQRAFHRFALRFHPDVRPLAEPRIREALTHIFERGAEAYRILAEPTLLARYRHARARGELRLLDISLRALPELATVLPSLHLSCRTAGAKLMAQSAAQAYARREPARVVDALRAALDYEAGSNQLVEDCLLAAEQL